jgi:hypothetical protein
MGWCGEFGGGAFWVERLGRHVTGRGGYGRWRKMVVRMDRLVG